MKVEVMVEKNDLYNKVCDAIAVMNEDLEVKTTLELSFADLVFIRKSLILEAMGLELSHVNLKDGMELRKAMRSKEVVLNE